MATSDQHSSIPRDFALSGDLNRFLLTGEHTGGVYAQWEAHVPPAGGPPLHVHEREDESFYILEGEVVCQLGDSRFKAQAGDCVYLPRGTPHRFHNESENPARVLVTVIPAGLERMFMEAGTEIRTGQPIPEVDRAQEVARLLASAERYGIRYFLEPRTNGAA